MKWKDVLHNLRLGVVLFFLGAFVWLVGDTILQATETTLHFTLASRILVTLLVGFVPTVLFGMLIVIIIDTFSDSF